MGEKPKTNGHKKADAATGEQRYAPECYACPIGTVSMAIQKVRPESTEHLLRAGRELLLAARGLLDGLSDYMATMEERSQSARVERIDIRRPAP